MELATNAPAILDSRRYAVAAIDAASGETALAAADGSCVTYVRTAELVFDPTFEVFTLPGRLVAGPPTGAPGAVAVAVS